jgi:hypothetical protein
MVTTMIQNAPSQSINVSRSLVLFPQILTQKMKTQSDSISVSILYVGDDRKTMVFADANGVVGGSAVVVVDCELLL